MASSSPAIEIPDGFHLHTENTSHILLDSNQAFLNPVQEFNRDTSIACIRVWSEDLNQEKHERWTKSQQKKTTREEPSASKPPQYRPYKFTILEALSATGLRSIRYAKEIPLVKYVLANDLSPAAVEAMKRNVAINNLGGEEKSAESSASKPKVVINKGDACSLMYNHRDEKDRVDVVDLDPYGTAAPFIDAAVQCINDGGLLCVTCTDLSVLATNNYPEKCFSNYGGVPIKAEYCHESALRLVLHSLSSSASRYGRFIEPLLSLSIDFYVRIFVRIRTSPLEVKKSLTKNSIFYICQTCQSHYEQPLGRMVSNVSTSGQTNHVFKTHPAPSVRDKCPECESNLHIAGPMWSGPLHNKAFVQRVLKHVEANQMLYGTAIRMKGMLTVANEELDNPFYFTPSKVASFFHCETPSLDDVASALLNAGQQVSRSHACPGSIKTNATHQQLHDIYRSWIKGHPVKMENISEASPARRLIGKGCDAIAEANFTRHPKTIGALENVRLVRYQENPRNWGPGRRAGPFPSPDLKRKRSSEVLEEPPAKH